MDQLLDIKVAERLMGGVVKPYSSDPYYAWLVVEVISNLGYKVSVSVNPLASVVTIEQDGKTQADVRGSITTVAKTICLAALEAVGSGEL